MGTATKTGRHDAGSRAALAFRWLAALRYVGTVCALAVVGCAAVDHRVLIAPARQQVCTCAKLNNIGCAYLDAVPVRFGAASVRCDDKAWRDGCYSIANGIEVTAIKSDNPILAEGGRYSGEPWGFRSQDELLTILRHEYLHAAGVEHGELMTACERGQ